MTDDRDLRDRLEAAVPVPPDLADGGPRARDRWRRNRRRRVGAVVAVAAIVIVAVPAIDAIGGTRQETATSPVRGPALGTGGPACHEVGTKDPDLGYLVDSRAIDSSTATAWLRSVDSSADPGAVAGATAVDVCLFLDKRDVYRLVAGASGRVPVMVSRGRYSSVNSPMRAMGVLDRLWTGGAATSDAPFRCPGVGARDDETVSSSLPLGTTGALLCYQDGTLYSPRAVLPAGSSQRLVTAIDESSITYSTPDLACAGRPGFRSYAIVFRYPTGTRVVRQEQCRGLAVGQFTRDASYDLDQQIEGLLLAQGQASGAPPACPSPEAGPQGVGDLRHVVAVRFCAAGDVTGQQLTGHRLERFERWGGGIMPGTGKPADSCTEPSAGWPHLTLLDAWGNAFTATVVCPRHFVAVVSDSASGRVVYPSSLTPGRFRGLFLRLIG